MIFKTAYITSWLGPAANYRDKRIAAHLKQLDWCAKVGLSPVVYAQEYPRDIVRDGVRYIFNDGEVQIADTARNVLLKEFYQTDEDFCIMVDDDSILYSGQDKYADGDSIFATMQNMDIGEFKHVDLFFPVSPRHEPFGDYVKANQETLKDYLVFETSLRAKGSMVFLKNIKKHHNLEIYLDGDKHRDENGVFVGGGDFYFAYQLMYLGLGVYKSKNLILNELASAHSSWAVGEDARSKYAVILNNLITNDFGVPMKQFKQRFNKHPQKLLVPKSEEIFTLESFMS